MYTTMNLGFGIGAVLDGAIFDATGDYQPALVINGLVGLAAAAAVYLPACFRADAPGLRGMRRTTSDVGDAVPAAGD